MVAAIHHSYHEAGCAEASHPATRKRRRDRFSSPHVEGGVGNFGGEGLGEQRQRLIFALQLAAVGEDLAVDFDGAVLEENFVAALVAEGRRGGERDVKFSSQTGVAFADGQDIAAVRGDGNRQGGVGGLGGIDEADAGVTCEGLAELGREQGAGLRDKRFIFNGLNVERAERELAGCAGTELVVRAARAGEKG